MKRQLLIVLLVLTKTIAFAQTTTDKRYDVKVVLTQIEAVNVDEGLKPGDNEEDLYGRIYLDRYRFGNYSNESQKSFWNVPYTDLDYELEHIGVNSPKKIDIEVQIDQNLTYDELINGEIVIDGGLYDAEWGMNYGTGAHYECDCERNPSDSQDIERRVKLNYSETVASVNRLEIGKGYTPVDFGRDKYFEMNFYEVNKDRQGSHIRFWFQLLIQVKNEITEEGADSNITNGVIGGSVGGSYNDSIGNVGNSPHLTKKMEKVSQIQEIKTPELKLTADKNKTHIPVHSNSDGLEIKTTLPEQITLHNTPDTSNYAYITLFGERLDLITGVRVAQNGKNEKGITAQRQQLSSLLPKHDKPLQQFNEKETYVVKITPTAKILPGTYRLEVFSNNKWISTRTQIHVKQKYAEKIKIEPQAKLSAIDNVKLKQSELEIKKAITEIEKKELLANTKIKNTVKDNFENNIKPDPNFKTAEIVDYYPKEKGQIDGYIVIIGKNLDSIKEVKIGDIKIAKKPDKKLAEGIYQKYLYPTGFAALSGKLIIQIPTKVGTKTINYDHTLSKSYQLIDRTEMQPSIELVSIVPYGGNYDDSIYVHQPFLAKLKITNAPGNYFSRDEINVYSPSASTKLIQINADESFPENNINYFGNCFVVYIKGIVRSDVYSSFTLNLGFNFKDTHKTDFVSSKNLSVNHKLASRKKYEIDETYNLKDKFSFKLISSWGSASGTAYGPNPLSDNDDIDVGLIKSENDLAFRIASGPVGTKAVWESNSLKLNPGWTVESITFNIDKVSPDGTNKVFCPAKGSLNLYYANLGRLVDFSFNAEDKTFGSPMDQLMFYFDETKDCSGNTFNASLDFSALFVRPITISMSADNTLINDHRIKVTIEKITLKGPHNKNANEAFNRGPEADSFNYIIVKDCNGSDVTPVNFLDGIRQ